MIKVIYTNTLNASKQESLFETQEQLEAHQALHPQMYDNSYTEIIPGKDAVVDENGVVLEEAVLQQQIQHANTMEVAITDITIEVLKQKNIDKYLKRIQFGQVLMAELAAMNKSSLDAGELTSEKIIELKKTLAPIKDFVSEGSLGFALSVLKTSEGLPPTIKEYFVKKISSYLESENGFA